MGKSIRQTKNFSSNRVALHKGRVGVESKLERDGENEDPHSVHENNGDKIQPNLWIAWTSQTKAFQPASRTDTVNEIAMVVVALTSPSWRVTVPFGTITCSATATSESLSSRLSRELPPEPNLAPVSIKDEHRLVLLQLWTQHDDQKTPWNVLGRYWVNCKAAVCIPSRHASPSRSRIRTCTWIHCVGPLGLDLLVKRRTDARQ